MEEAVSDILGAVHISVLLVFIQKKLVDFYKAHFVFAVSNILYT